MNYARRMQKVAEDCFDNLYKGVDELVFTDFPDYANVGDSAIALGQLRYFRKSNKTVRNIFCIGSLHKDVLMSEVPVMINGGGNIAGLYPVIDRHRYTLSESLRPDSLLVQAPQSVHFASAEARLEFQSRFASRKRLRTSVRDERSYEQLEGLVDELLLAPDAVHHLGVIEAEAPTKAIVVLARTDLEAASPLVRSVATVDWLKDDLRGRIGTAYRWRSQKMHYNLALNLSNERWTKKAERRLQRGVDILSHGQTVVTDRLHAMLIGLQMGRRVVAVDNNTGKLGAYASKWLQDAEITLSFAPNLEAAIEEAHAY